jgi:pilus assembly protein TadC
MVILVLWILGKGQISHQSLTEVADQISREPVIQIFAVIALSALIAQQVVRAKAMRLPQPTLNYLILLLGFGEVPGLLGFIVGIQHGGNLGLALPFILVSIFSFVFLKPVVLKMVAPTIPSY